MRVKAYFDRIGLDHKDFDYLDYKEKKEIEMMVAMSKAKIVEFKRGNKHLASAIFTLESDSVHAHEIAGNFPDIIKMIDNLAIAMAQVFKKNMVTFRASRDAVARIGKKLGYTPYENDKELLYKVVV